MSTNPYESVGKVRIIQGVAILTALFLFAIFSAGSLFSYYKFGIITFPSSLFVLGGIFLLGILLVRYGWLLEKVPSRYFWIGLVVFFLVVKIAWLILIPTQVTSDFANYDAAARALASGQGTQTRAFVGLNGWGYPLFLGVLYRIFGQTIVVGKVANLLLDLAALGLIFLITRQALSPLSVRWSALLYAVWPVQIAFTSVLGTEHLGVVLGMSGALCFLQGLQGKKVWRNLVLCGVFFGLGYITRPAMIAMVAAASLAIFFAPISFKRSVLLSGLILMAFVGTNAAYMLGLKVFNNGITPDPNWSYGANLVFGSNYDSGGTWNMDDALLLASWPSDTMLANAVEVVKYRFSVYTPLQVLDLAARKANFFWTAVYYGVFWSAYFRYGPEAIVSPTFQPLFNAQFYFQSAATLLASAGAFLTFRKPQPFHLFLFLILLFVTMVHVLVVTDSRYQYSFEPYLLILAALAASFSRKSFHADI